MSLYWIKFLILESINPLKNYKIPCRKIPGIHHEEAGCWQGSTQNRYHLPVVQDNGRSWNLYCYSRRLLRKLLVFSLFNTFTLLKSSNNAAEYPVYSYFSGSILCSSLWAKWAKLSSSCNRHAGRFLDWSVWQFSLIDPFRLIISPTADDMSHIPTKHSSNDIIMT